MIAWLRKILAPPVFEDDEEKTRVARLLNIILLFVMSLIMLFSVPAWLTTPEFGRIAIELFLALWAVVMLLMLHRGYVRRAGFLLSFTLWAAVTYGTYEAGGFSGSTMSAYFGIILIAELLLGIWAGVIFGGLSIGAASLMIYMDELGLLPAAPAYITQETFFWEFTAVVIGVVVLLSLVMSSLHQALARARHNEKELAQKVEEIQLLAQQALEASEFKTHMLARVSHELRTPLGALMGLAEMVDQNVYGELTTEQHEAMMRVIHNAHILDEVVSELLDQSQIEMGQLVLKEEKFSPRELMLSVRDKALPQAQVKGLSLRIDLDSDLPRILIGDKQRIEQILSNLVFNAIKFTDKGYVLIHAGSVGEDQWIMQVVDTGIGMDEEELLDIFEPFRQVDESIERQFGGVGLGLSIVKQLVAEMSGSVNVTSHVGTGSTFTVLLPQHIMQDLPPARQPTVKSLKMIGD
jgi:signal transduction histidine kinase